MPIGVVLAVIVSMAALLRAAIALAAVMLCRSAQRQGREVRFESRHFSHHLCFYCGPEALDETTPRPTNSDAAREDHPPSAYADAAVVP